MRVRLLHKLAEHIPEDHVASETDRGRRKMVSDARDAGLLRMNGGAAPNFPTTESPTHRAPFLAEGRVPGMTPQIGASWIGFHTPA